MIPIGQELQQYEDEHMNGYQLLSDETIIMDIIEFGSGMKEFNTVDINRIIVENQRMKTLLNIKEI
tara:strand:+ start:3539 stop:3736 length:198 start_codon:yes stop_codon:yes gene_type:complete